MLIYCLRSCGSRLNGYCQRISSEVPSPNTLYESKVSKEYIFCIWVIYFISITAKPSLHWAKAVQIPLCPTRVKMKTPHKRAGACSLQLSLHHKLTQRAKKNYENFLKKAKPADSNWGSLKSSHCSHLTKKSGNSAKSWKYTIIWLSKGLLST